MLEFPEELERRLDRVASILDENDKFRIITHYDADGISAGAVLARSLMKDQKGFHMRFISSFPEEIPRGLPLIFTDIGNSHLKEISQIDEDVIVLDHHDIKEEEYKGIDDKNKIIINPHEFGIDGSQEVSGATLALVSAVWLDENNWVETFYGLAGATADKQALNGFKGLNLKIAEEAVEKGHLKKRNDLLIDGEGIEDALMKACDPYFPDISGRKKEIKSMLDDIDIDLGSDLASIGKEKKRKLTSLLVLSLLKKDRPVDVINSIKGLRYESKHRRLNTDLLYKILNSCARNDRTGLGLLLCLGDEDAMKEAKEIRREYRVEMISKLNKLRKNIEELDHIQYFYEEKRTRKGELAGLGMQYILKGDKPVLGLAEDEERIDISARATQDMIKNGLDLGELFYKLAKRFGSSGGGHDIAAGATVPKEDIDEFLDSMDEEVGAILD